MRRQELVKSKTAGARGRAERRHGLGFLGLCLVLLLCPASPSFSQQITQQVRISSSPNPVGSGARALGMGGAFIAVADDATAASWNPGGLVQLERPEVSIVGSYSLRREDYTSGTHPEASGARSFDHADLNYLSAVYPFTLLGRNIVVSLNLQRLYDLRRQLDFPYTQQETLGPDARFVLSQDIHFDQRGGLKALSPAFCVQVTPRFSVGATLNIWTDRWFRNGWEEHYRSSGAGKLVVGKVAEPFTTETDIRDEYDELRGVNFHLGFLREITPRITLGGVFKSALTARLRHRKTTRISQAFLDDPLGPTSFIDRFSEDVKLTFPMSYGLGVAVRFSDAFSCALDLFRTEWGAFQFIDGAGRKTSPLDGRPAGQSDIDATHQVRLGAEYLFIGKRTVVPLRAGVFYDPEPSEGSPEDFFGLSVGSGLALGPLVLDAAYQVRFGRGVAGDAVGVPETDADVLQHRWLVSAIVHF